MDKETKLYNELLANSLMTAGLAVLELLKAREDMKLDSDAAYSPEMITIAEKIRTNGYDNTKNWLMESFNEGQYNILSQKKGVKKEYYSIRMKDGSEYSYEDPELALQYYFSLSENADRNFILNSYAEDGTVQSFLLIATISRDTTRFSVDTEDSAIKGIIDDIMGKSDRYILPDELVSDYKDGRSLCVNKVPEGYDYYFVNDEKVVLSGTFDNLDLNIMNADSVIKQAIFEYGVRPENNEPIARINSREFEEMFGVPPYEGTFKNISPKDNAINAPDTENIVSDNNTPFATQKDEKTYDSEAVGRALNQLKNLYSQRYHFSLSQDELERVVMDEVSKKVAAAGLDVDKLEVVIISGSYANGTENRYSDLDVEIIYTGNSKEADLKNVLDDEPLMIDGVTIDIHPRNADGFNLDSFIAHEAEYYYDYENAQERTMSAEICDLLYGDFATPENYLDICDCLRTYDESTEGEKLLKMDIQKINEDYSDNKISYEYLKSKEALDYLDDIRARNIDNRTQSVKHSR